MPFYDPKTLAKHVVQGVKDAMPNFRDPFVAKLQSDESKLEVTEAGGLGRVTAINVATTATDLSPTPLNGRSSVLIHNLGSDDLYVGFDSNVAAATGIPVPASGGSVSLSVRSTQKLYGIVANAQTSPNNTRVTES